MNESGVSAEILSTIVSADQLTDISVNP